MVTYKMYDEVIFMRYYAKYDELGTLILIGTGPGGVEITESEYEGLLSEIRAKAYLVNLLYNGEITIDDVPTEWQEEIQRRADERRANEPNPEEVEVTEEDLINALTEVGVI